MSHYRKITIDDKTYEYNIGFNYLKIKNVGLYRLNQKENEIYQVTPSMIEKIIRNSNPKG